MKFRKLLFSAITLFSLQANAQTWVADSVEMTAGYAKDIFYSFKNSTQKTEANDNWHLAFEMLPQSGPNSNVSILANHVAGKVNVYSLHMKATGKFGTALSTGDTTGKVALYNADTSWNYGAFNRMSSSNPFDFSWGFYDMTSHFVNGDSLYLITINNAAYQVWIQQYKSTPADSIQYIFNIANFDGTNAKQKRVYRKDGYTDRNFAYYDVINDVIKDREPGSKAWDIIFTRAIENVPVPPPGTGLAPYPVTTVLSNFGVTVAEVIELNPAPTGYATRPYLKDIHVIGSDWKKAPAGPPPATWTVRDSANYFVRTENSMEYYQLHFTRFDGSSNGKAVFEKRKLGDIVSVKDIENNVSAYSLSPNPTSNGASLMIDAKESAEAMFLVTDVTGKVLQQNPVTLNAGLNGFRINTTGYATGTYLVTVTNGTWKIAEKLSVQN